MTETALLEAKVPVDGGELTFWCSNPNDAIQGSLLKGELWDREELDRVTAMLADGDVIADVGTNVGNHAVYFAHCFPASKIFVFEPNDEAADLLVRNLDANNCTNVDRTFIGAGLSDKNTEAVSWRGGANNLGNSKLMDMSEADRVKRNPKNFNLTRLHRGDEVFADQKVDFIKIDVEGHELEALEGLRATIMRDRPLLFVESQNSNLEAFHKIIDELGYALVWKDEHYAMVTNFLLQPA